MAAATLHTSAYNVGAADEAAEKLSAKLLTRHNAAMAAMFAELPAAEIVGAEVDDDEGG